ncbi:MAG: acetolactate synthase large subunit [Thermoguttaceae bacterium]
MKAAELFVRCLENEGVKYLFGLPGEENLDVMDAMLDSTIKFVTTRHEQAAAFMADVYGRLTCKAGVCLATLGPGATNLITGVADANLDYAPMVAISGQAATTSMHKESHQHLDLVNLFRPITKYCTQVIEPQTVPEVVRKAFKQAQTGRFGVSYIDFPENVAKMEVEGQKPLTVHQPVPPVPAPIQIQRAAEMINKARCPIILAGNGVVRAGGTESLLNFAEKLNIPVVETFMTKGVIPSSHRLCLGTVGLKAHDYVLCAFDRADLIICVGYDMVEYHPHPWNPDKRLSIIHFSAIPAEVDEHYSVALEVQGHVGWALRSVGELVQPKQSFPLENLRKAIAAEMSEMADDNSFPLKPQRIVWDIRRALAPDATVICDVGAHKLWMARMYPAERPNTCIISNGFAAMGISLPGAIAAKLAFPERTAVAVCGDAGFMMNSQELETALRIGTPLVVLIWTDNGYGLIEWHQLQQFGRISNVRFGNPDFVKFAESFGAKGYRVRAADELLPILKQAVADNTVAVIDCPVDYSENMKLTEKLGKMVCPV